MSNKISISEPQSLVTPGDPRAVHRRVLIVDDHLDAAESLAMMMKTEGHEVRMAFDGIDAVKAAEAFLPHIVFLDLALPKLSGSEAALRIRQQSWSKGMILIALTGWSADEDRRQSRELGFDDYLVKPAKPEELKKIIERLADQS
ncbi:MAG TPA: response regulator [Burkholderiales bacterium]